MLLEGMLLLEDLEQDMLVLDQKLDLDLYIRIPGSLVAVSMGLLLLLVLLSIKHHRWRDKHH